MQIEYLRLKNFRTFRDVEMSDIPRLAVLVGANGSGKSTLFSVFAFLRDAMESNVTVALTKLSGNRGFREVRSRDADGAIEIELQFRPNPQSPLLTYLLCIDQDPKTQRNVVAREVLQYQRQKDDKACRLLDFSHGKGETVTNQAELLKNDIALDAKNLQREQQSLKSADILAIKGLAQFEKFPVAVAVGDFIEGWYVSELDIQSMRTTPEAVHAEHLSRTGDNLAQVIAYLHEQHPQILEDMCAQLARRIPGMVGVKPKRTESGMLLLEFQDAAFKQPFLVHSVSDGTIKTLAYLTLLYDPKPHPMLFVEEPENQLYHSPLEELAEEFRLYAVRGGQVVISTHSPEFLSAMEVQEVYWLKKQSGYTTIKHAKDDKQVSAYMAEGDKMGHLWYQGFFPGVHPA